MGIILSLILFLFCILGTVLLYKSTLHPVFKWTSILLLCALVGKTCHDYYALWNGPSKKKETAEMIGPELPDAKRISTPKSMWTIQSFESEFPEITDEKYITNNQTITGTFSNDMYEEAPLSVDFIICNKHSISFKLYRQGALLHTKRDYSVLVQNKNGDRQTLTATQRGDRVTFSQTDAEKSSANRMYYILLKGGEIKFHLTPVSPPFNQKDKYYFEIENADHLEEVMQEFALKQEAGPENNLTHQALNR